MLRFIVIMLCVFIIAGCGSGGGGSSSGSSFDADASGELTEFSYDDSQDSDDLASTPEPSTLILFGIGLGGFAAKMLWKRKKHANSLRR